MTMESSEQDATLVQLVSVSNIDEQSLQTQVESTLRGRYLKLNINGKITSCKIEDITDDDNDKTKTITHNTDEPTIMELVGESTNAWLYVKLPTLTEQHSHNKLNKFIAGFVIILQIVAYITMTLFLKGIRQNNIRVRQDSCYGPNCNDLERPCLVVTTGSLCSVLLIGFLWADVVNTVAFFGKGYIWAPLLILTELMTAIACGFYVGLYSEDDFDAIGGAIGILFVHDLDEKVYASMKLFEKEQYSMHKKILSVLLWIIVSFGVAWGVACTYISNNSVFGSGCIQGQFQCDDGDCIWSGLVCNGVKDCPNGEDEGNSSNCDYSLITCQNDTFFTCKTTGFCIPIGDQYNGVFDCDDWSDEGHAPFRMYSNETETVESISKRCDESAFQVMERYPLSNDTYHKQWKGVFKCDNGQCIDAKYACDGVMNDCVDGSDEYPIFDKRNEFPFYSWCPYAQLIKCRNDQVLCKINGACIQKDALCDGKNDCPDGADERLCDYDCEDEVLSLELFQCDGDIAKINETHLILFSNVSAFYRYDSIDNVSDIVDFTTQNGKCIPYEFRCDSTIDCEDGSDERLCQLFPCDDKDYRCISGGCIIHEWLCDGFDDCADADDENGTVCLNEGAITFAEKCKLYDFGYPCLEVDLCIGLNQVCDGKSDCPFGDDEGDVKCYQDIDENDIGKSENASSSATNLFIIITLVALVVLCAMAYIFYERKRRESTVPPLPSGNSDDNERILM